MTVKTTLYETDFNLWLEEQVLALQQKRFKDLDIENLVEEIESLSRSDGRSVASNLTIVLMQLLKYEYQPSHRSKSWRLTLREHRRRIERILVDSPSLKPYIAEILETCYQDAVGDVAEETGLPLETFPKQCPFSVEEALNIDFLQKF